jgi:2-hydroxychromene-2-carboxylate isomerase
MAAASRHGGDAPEENAMITSDTAATSSILWYFDVVSPFSYLALPGVEALARRRPVAFRPVLLGALLSHWGGLGPAEIPPKRLHTYRLCQFMAARAGLRLRFPPRHPFQSLPAQRLLAALGADAGVVRTVFDFVWKEGRDPSEPAELASLCHSLGVDDHAAVVEERGAKAALRAATEEAAAAGVFGVPTLAIGRELFWGVDAMPLAEAYLEDGGLFTRGEMARLAALPVGVERRRQRNA